jgi:hypothetical protein
MGRGAAAHAEATDAPTAPRPRGRGKEGEEGGDGGTRPTEPGEIVAIVRVDAYVDPTTPEPCYRGRGLMEGVEVACCWATSPQGALAGVAADLGGELTRQGHDSAAHYRARRREA